MHYYTYLGNSTVRMESLLDEDKLRSAIQKFKVLRVSRRAQNESSFPVESAFSV